MTGSGKVSKEVADTLALEHYEQYNAERLRVEAEREALADDAELKAIEDVAEKKGKSPRKKGAK